MCDSCVTLSQAPSCPGPFPLCDEEAGLQHPFLLPDFLNSHGEVAWFRLFFFFLMWDYFERSITFMLCLGFRVVTIWRGKAS